MRVHVMFGGLLAVALGLSSLTPAQAFSPNDPLYGQQWALGDMGLSTAWNYNQGGRSDVRVAVLDTGVAYDSADFAQTHFDLSWAYDFINNRSGAYDDNGHGSLVTGVIAQSTNNGTGAAGIAWGVTIIPIKVLNSEGVGTSASLVNGIKRAISAGADIINISWGSADPNSDLEAACRSAYQAGALVVAAAGNDGGSQAVYPARYSYSLPVAALNPSNSLWGGSNSAYGYGGPGLSAPGADILQVTKAGAVAGSGASYAAPQVSGVAALVLSEAYDLGLSIPGKGSGRVDWLKNVLYSTAEDLGAGGADGTYGYGLVRADTALQSLQGGASYAATALGMGVAVSPATFPTGGDWFATALEYDPDLGVYYRPYRGY